MFPCLTSPFYSLQNNQSNHILKKCEWGHSILHLKSSNGFPSKLTQNRESSNCPRCYILLSSSTFIPAYSHSCSVCFLCSLHCYSLKLPINLTVVIISQCIHALNHPCTLKKSHITDMFNFMYLLTHSSILCKQNGTCPPSYCRMASCRNFKDTCW